MRLPGRRRRGTAPPDGPETTETPATADGPESIETPRTAEPAGSSPTADSPAATAPEESSAHPDDAEPVGVADEWVAGGAPRRPWASAAVTCAVLIAAIAAVGLAQTSSGHTVLRKAGLAERARPFTELYFLHPRHIPLAVIKQSPRQTVSFVIRNAEHTRRTYSWTIGTRGSAPAASGTVSLDVGHWATIVRKVRVDCSAKRAYEQVALPASSEKIGYWLTCRSLTPAKKR